MKAIVTIFFAIVLTCNLVTAQDTLYIYKSGAVVTKRAVNDIDSVIFYKALDPAGVVDIVGNVYHTVTLGTQTWMVENLKTTKYNDGTNIPIVTSASAWALLTTPAYCWYLNNSDNKNTYGALYNWYTIYTGKLAPIGWHVPTDAEWTTLEIFLQNNGYNWDGSMDTDNDRTTNNSIAKSLASATNWTSSSNEGAVGNTDNSSYRNKSGFAGLPGGYRYSNGTFYNIGSYSNWWSSTEPDTSNAWNRGLYYGSSSVSRTSGSKQYGFSVRCVRGVDAQVLGVPIPTTTETNNITTTSASFGSFINYDGGIAVTASGVCWNTTGSPTTADRTTTDGTLSGFFTSSITGLTPGTMYYIRAWATNSFGTGYGNVVSIGTKNEISPTFDVIDIDGNGYHTVKIGTQIWMVENLKTTKYNDGTSIPLVSDGTAWHNLSTPGYCWYNNDAANKNIYGALYNWYTVNTNKLAPTGWHVPTDAEWTTLENYLIANGYNYDGTTTGNKIAKSLATTTDWTFYSGTGAIGNDLTKNNTSSFAGLPGGYRNDYGSFNYIGSDGYWWSSTQVGTGYAWSRYLNYGNSNVLGGDPYSYYIGEYGFSVRCIMDPLAVYTTSVSNITTNSAICGGNILTLGSAPVTERGICYSTSQNPTTSNSKIVIGSGAGTFSGTVSGLTANTTYYLRAYAINNSGTVYGNENAFKTFTGSVTDNDGNVYDGICNDPETSLLGKFMKSYQKDSLDEMASVASGIVDGKMVYVDSVMIATNLLLSELGSLNNEDSSYWMVAPTDVAWTEAYNRIAPYYNFSFISGASSLQDYWTKHTLINDAIFNPNEQKSIQDSLISTKYNAYYNAYHDVKYHVFHKPFDSGGILSNIKSKVVCSNGYIYKVDKWPFKLQEIFFHPIKVEAERDASVLFYTLSTLNVQTAIADSISNNQYIQVVPDKAASNPTITFEIPNTLSGKYDVCIVCVPRSVYAPSTNPTDSLKNSLPYKFKATLYYANEAGVIKSYTCGNIAYSNNPYKMDTVCVAKGFKFPTCNFGQDAVTVSLKISCFITSLEAKTFSREMFFDCIYLKPNED